MAATGKPDKRALLAMHGMPPPLRRYQVSGETRKAADDPVASAGTTLGGGHHSPPMTTPASATRAATVPTTRPVVRAYGIDGGRLGPRRARPRVS